MTEADVKLIPGYGGRYMISRDGRVWWWNGEHYVRKATFGDPARVSLRRRGRRYRPYIKTLVKKYFEE